MEVLLYLVFFLIVWFFIFKIVFKLVKVGFYVVLSLACIMALSYFILIAMSSNPLMWGL